MNLLLPFVAVVRRGVKGKIRFYACRGVGCGGDIFLVLCSRMVRGRLCRGIECSTVWRLL